MVMARFTEAVSNWTVIQFSMRDAPMTFSKTKEGSRYDRPITGDVPCGCSSRNPSNIMNILDFLNVRMQCSIRGAESQCSAGDETQSLQSVHF